MRKIILATLAVLSVAASVPARADDIAVQHTRVSYGDLNLRSPAGIATLRHRLSLASRNVCGDGVEWRSPPTSSPAAMKRWPTRCPTCARSWP